MAGPSQIWLRGGMRGACGDMPAIGERFMDGDPYARDIAGDGVAGPMKLVSTVWVQRALNGWYAVEGLATRVAVDGVAGSRTLQALVDMRSRLLATSSATGYGLSPYPRIVDTGHVAIAPVQYDMLTLNLRVADPVGSTVGLCSWAAVPRTVTQTTTSSGETHASPAPSDSIPVTSEWTNVGSSWSVESIVVPAVAFLGAAALGFGLMKLGAPRRHAR